MQSFIMKNLKTMTSVKLREFETSLAADIYAIQDQELNQSWVQTILLEPIKNKYRAEIVELPPIIGSIE